MEIKRGIFILLLHAIILQANNSNSIDFRHAHPPLMSLIFYIIHSDHNRDISIQSVQTALVLESPLEYRLDQE